MRRFLAAAIAGSLFGCTEPVQPDPQTQQQPPQPSAVQEEPTVATAAAGATAAGATAAGATADDSPAEILAVGQPAPDFTVTGIDDQPVQLSQRLQQGKPIVLIFSRAHW